MSFYKNNLTTIYGFKITRSVKESHTYITYSENFCSEKRLNIHDHILRTKCEKGSDFNKIS